MPSGSPGVFIMVPANRATFFIDGNNWYHTAKSAGVNISSVDYKKIAKKLSRKRGSNIVEILYYVGKVSGDLKRSRMQQKFLSVIEKQGINIVLGRVERKPVAPEKNPIQRELAKFLDSYSPLIKNSFVVNSLKDLISQTTYTYTEKRVDVNIAVDMVVKAMKDEFDDAYLISADGDFVPAVQTVMEMNKKVFAASPLLGRELAKKVDYFFHLHPDWFSNDIFVG